MAKQIKRFGLAIVLITVVGVVVIAPLAKSFQTGPPGQGDPEIAQAVRGLVGFGPVDVLPALAQDNNHRQMIAHARSFVADHEAELAPLVANYKSANTALVHAITWGEDTEQAYHQLNVARQAVTGAVGPLLPSLIDGLPPGQNDLPPFVQLNLELDPEMRTLDLTIAQRRAVVAAQRQRDMIILNARFMYAQRRRAETKEAFEQALQAVLTPDQLSVVQASRQRLQTRLLEMATAEVEPFQGE